MASFFICESFQGPSLKPKRNSLLILTLINIYSFRSWHLSIRIYPMPFINNILILKILFDGRKHFIFLSNLNLRQKLIALIILTFNVNFNDSPSLI